ncbi:TPA: hypothetical protein ROY08_001351 [Bacillus cereus]|nr:hypothetical protein [Bacillus cereus]
MKISGTATIIYNVDINTKSILVSDMSIEKSDALIKEAIEKKYGVLLKDDGDIHVATMETKETSR